MPRPNDDSDLEKVVRRFRRALLRGERQAASEMVRYYGEAWKRIRNRVVELAQQIQEARERGEEVRPLWLYEMERLQTLQRQVEDELHRFALFAEERIIAQQREAVEAAQQYAHEAAKAALRADAVGVEIPWNRLHASAVQEMVGLLQDGSPLRDLLMELGPDVVQGVADALVQGVVLGVNPRETARLVRKQFGMGLVRALRISRTETLRVYRQAAHESFRANRDVIKGWIWHASLSPRTCASCIAMHGTFHSLDETLNDHPNGRCTPVPATRSWKEIGEEYGFDLGDVPDTRIEVESGEEWFRRQPEEVQRRILGHAGYEAWRSGVVRLQDFAGKRVDPKWGAHWYRRSLREILGEDKARKWYKQGISSGRRFETLKKVEQEIFNKRYEVAVAVGDDGRIILRKRGTKREVRFTEKEVRRIRGTVFTHNHPGGWDFARDDPRRVGNSFSPEDIMFAAKYELQEVRAVTPKYVFTMRPGDAGWPSVKAIEETFWRIDGEVRNEFWEKIKNGEMTVEEAESIHWHEVNKRVAQALKLVYNRTEHNYK